MTNASSAPPRPANLDALETFMEFPAALALLDSVGRVELANLVFLARSGDDQLAEAPLRALAQDPDGAWRSVQLGLKGEANGTHASARSALRIGSSSSLMIRAVPGEAASSRCCSRASRISSAWPPRII